jgi:hypothetical protein
LGLPKTESITPDTIRRLYAETAKPYQALESLTNASGQPARINLARDSQYLQSVRQAQQRATSGVTGAVAPQVRELFASYLKPKQGATVADTMKDIQQLRFDAGKNFKSDDPSAVALGHAQRRVALALEASIERQVGARNPQVVSEWQAARQQRAKVHAVEDAMVGTEIDGRLLARARDHGELLTGRLAEIADVAEAMPHMMQANSRLGQTAGLGLLDASMTAASAGGAGLLTGNLPLALAAGVAWPAARYAGRQIGLGTAPGAAVRATTATAGAAGTAGAAQTATQMSQLQPGESFGDFVRRRQAEMKVRQ